MRVNRGVWMGAPAALSPGRSGITNEFTYRGRVYRSSNGADDLLELALWLAHTPCGPLFGAAGVGAVVVPPATIEIHNSK